MLIEYKTEVRKFYDSKYLPSFTAGTNHSYNSAIESKLNFKSHWERVIFNFKNSGYYVRDLTPFAHLHTNKLLIEISELEGSVILHISHLPSYIGFSYYHPTKKTLTSISGRNVSTNLSFFPFSDLQLQLTRDIIIFISSIKTTLSLFNNIYANSSINDVIIDCTIQKETTLFQVVFDTNFVGIL